MARSPRAYVDNWASVAYRLRHQYGWTNGRIAGRFSVAPRTVQRWCKGVEEGRYSWPSGLPYYISRAPGWRPVYCFNCGVRVA